MPPPNPEHLLLQAEKLATPTSAGPPRQADLRRAISAAYYAVFHMILASGANTFAGSNAYESEYALVYRSLSHTHLKKTCADLSKHEAPDKYKPYGPNDGFDQAIKTFAKHVSELQKKRNAVDYDPQHSSSKTDADKWILNARDAIEHFNSASTDHQRRFLFILFFPPRAD